MSLRANLTFPLCQSLYGEFHLDDMEFDESLAKFRVEKQHLETLQRLCKYQEHDVILPTPFHVPKKIVYTSNLIFSLAFPTHADTCICMNLLKLLNYFHVRKRHAKSRGEKCESSEKA